MSRLPTLLQKVAQVSDPCPPYLQQPQAPSSSPRGAEADSRRMGPTRVSSGQGSWDQGLRGGELSFYLGDFRGGLCLADVAQHMRPPCK